MATWPELKGYLAANYRISEDIGYGLKLEFRTGENRSQLVFMTHHVLLDGAEDWVVIESPFGPFGRTDLAAAVAAAGTMVCGGIGTFMDQYVTLRHAVPLANLDVNEIERPLALVTMSADRLEAALVGGDRF